MHSEAEHLPCDYALRCAQDLAPVVDRATGTARGAHKAESAYCMRVRPVASCMRLQHLPQGVRSDSGAEFVFAPVPRYRCTEYAYFLLVHNSCCRIEGSCILHRMENPDRWVGRHCSVSLLSTSSAHRTGWLRTSILSRLKTRLISWVILEKNRRREAVRDVRTVLISEFYHGETQMGWSLILDPQSLTGEAQTTSSVRDKES